MLLANVPNRLRAQRQLPKAKQVLARLGKRHVCPQTTKLLLPKCSKSNQESWLHPDEAQRGTS
jgi:hypothetical protein